MLQVDLDALVSYRRLLKRFNGYFCEAFRVPAVPSFDWTTDLLMWVERDFDVTLSLFGYHG